MTLRGKSDPGWAALVAEWKETQARLRERMIVAPLEPLPRFVAGADCAFSADKKTIFAAAIVYDRETQRVIEIAHATRPVEFPYVPGFLSFREGPAVKQAIRALKHEFGAILFDGQGFAHPRRCGIASHLAIELDTPGVGVGKSRLIGEFADPAMNHRLGRWHAIGRHAIDQHLGPGRQRHCHLSGLPSRDSRPGAPKPA